MYNIKTLKDKKNLRLLDVCEIFKMVERDIMVHNKELNDTELLRLVVQSIKLYRRVM